MFKKLVAPALIALGIAGASLAPAAHAQKPSPSPKMGGKMDKMAGGKMAGGKMDKKMPMRGKDGKFVKKSDKMSGGKMAGGSKMSGGKMDKMAGGKMDKMAGGKMAGGKMDKMAAGKPVYDAKLNQWRLNGKFIKASDAIKMGGKK